MFSPSSDIAFPLLVITLLGWGMWPFLRSETKFPMPVFALFNVSGQIVSALILLSSLGVIKYGDNEVNCWDVLMSETYVEGRDFLSMYLLTHLSRIEV